jgi:3-phytase
MRFPFRKPAALALLAAAAAVQAAPPASEVHEAAALDGGASLVLLKNAVELRDAAGRTTASFALRGESLDVRGEGRQALAVVVDANTQRVLPLRIDLDRGTLSALAALPDARQSVSAACLYQDAQGLTHAFVIGRNGVATQWLLRGDGAQAVRTLAVAPDAESCRVDDRTHRLFVSEEGGVWAHPAAPEGASKREAVALLQPHGPLRQGGGPLAVLADGSLAVGDSTRGEVLRVARRDGVWKSTGGIALSRGGEPTQLALWRDGGVTKLAVRNEAADGWVLRSLPRSLASAATSTEALPIVMARVQTEPVGQFGDAADDPAIWVHATDAALSRVLGTDKKRGLAVYDLQGRQLQFLTVGRLNNVDLRQDVTIGGERLDLAVATQRDDRSIVLFRIATDGTVSEFARLPTPLKDVYGICLYRSPKGVPEVFVNDKDGRFLHWRIVGTLAQPVAQPLREFRVATQPEGCVADDRNGVLFFGEEKRGVWRVAIEGRAQPVMVLPVGRWLTADVEGMGLYQAGDANYLVVSSQGSDSYVVLDAAAPHRVRGAFRIGINAEAGIDGVSDTDGLELVSRSLGPKFPQGLLVVQDGRKVLPEAPQNFKYVAWEDIAKALRLD